MEKELEAAKESLGDIESRDAKLKFADFLARTSSIDKAVEAYKEVLAEKSTSTGIKIDIYLRQIRLGWLYKDSDLVEASVKSAKE